MTPTTTLEFKWTTSRGRDTYGYNICTLYVNGQKVSACNGGGYDMKGTALGDWVARAYADQLRALKPSQMPQQAHWQPDDLAYVCYACIGNAALKEQPRYRARIQTWEAPRPHCPGCGKQMQRDNRTGTMIQEGHYFYGLTFHDPDYDPGKAKIGKDCADRTLGLAAKGKTVAQAEKDGKSLGLERYQAIYTASSKHSTKRHRIPSIDGACGLSAVVTIMEAIGLTLESIRTRSKKSDMYTLIVEGGK